MSEKNDFKGKAGVFAAAAAQKARGLAVYAATKTKQFSRVAKLNVDIASQKDTIKSAYAEIGRLYYEAHREAPEGFFLQLCQEIDTAKEAIAAMEAEIAQLKEEAAAKAQQASQPAQDADFEAVVDEAEADIQVEIVDEDALDGDVDVDVFQAGEDTAAPDPEAKILRDAVPTEVVYPTTVAPAEEPAPRDPSKPVYVRKAPAEPVAPPDPEATALRDAAKADAVYPMTVDQTSDPAAEEPSEQ